MNIIKKTVKIGGTKYKLEDLPPDLRKKIEEQVPEFKIQEKSIKSENIESGKSKKIKNSQKKKQSLYRKIFGYGKAD